MNWFMNIVAIIVAYPFIILGYALACLSCVITRVGCFFLGAEYTPDEDEDE